VTYLGSDRFVVRECHGYDVRYESRSTTIGGPPLASLVVLDRAYCFAKVHELYLDDVPRGGVHWEQHERHAELYRRANAFVAALEGGRCTGGTSASGDSLLTPAADHPPLSPFDSGCPR
jgi:hypothetical protein